MKQMFQWKFAPATANGHTAPDSKQKKKVPVSARSEIIPLEADTASNEAKEATTKKSAKPLDSSGKKEKKGKAKGTEGKKKRKKKENNDKASTIGTKTTKKRKKAEAVPKQIYEKEVEVEPDTEEVEVMEENGQIKEEEGGGNGEDYFEEEEDEEEEEDGEEDTPLVVPNFKMIDLNALGAPFIGRVAKICSTTSNKGKKMELKEAVMVEEDAGRIGFIAKDKNGKEHVVSWVELVDACFFSSSSAKQ